MDDLMACRTFYVPPVETAPAIIGRHVLYIVGLFLYPFEHMRRYRSRWNSWEPVKCACGWVGMRGPNVLHEYDYYDSIDVEPVDLCPFCREEV